MGRCKPVVLSTGQAELFDQWWAEYPKKVCRQDAVRAWSNIEPEPTQEAVVCMISALKWQKRLTEWGNYQFIPYPATYLNGRRWEDEPPPKPKPQPRMRDNGTEHPERVFLDKCHLLKMMHPDWTNEQIADEAGKQ